LCQLVFGFSASCGAFGLVGGWEEDEDEKVVFEQKGGRKYT